MGKQDQPARKQRVENVIYWLKDKISTSVDLARISFSRIEERTDEVLREFKIKLLAENLQVKPQVQKNSQIYIKLSGRNLQSKD